MSRGAPRPPRRRALITAALLMAALAPAPWAAEPEPAGERRSTEMEEVVAGAAAAALQRAVTVTVESGKAGLEVEGRCRLKAMPAAAWAVLTDYEGIPGFVSSMRESRVTERAPDHVVVEQAAVGHLFFFSRGLKTRLRVEEEPPRVIRFEDLLRSDFETYRGSWRIEGDDAEIEIIYALSAKPAFNVPEFVARGAFKRAARNLIAEVGAEIERRAEQAGLSGLEGN